MPRYSDLNCVGTIFVSVDSEGNRSFRCENTDITNEACFFPDDGTDGCLFAPKTDGIELLILKSKDDRVWEFGNSRNGLWETTRFDRESGERVPKSLRFFDTGRIKLDDGDEISFNLVVS